MKFDWLQVCPDGVTENCIQPVQIAYLLAVIVGAVVLGVIARRSRDLSTSTLSLMVVAIAINIAVGSLTVALRLPIYLDSIGTVLVGVLAGPWAGALTGILANLIWSILPVPGGAGPIAAFFAPTAAVIGLMAGFWASQGVFRLRPDDARVGGFLAIATGIAATMIGLIVVQTTIGIPSLAFDDPNALDNQMRFVLISLALVAVGVVAAWVTRRTIYRLEDRPESARRYLTVAAAVSAGALLFALFRLLFGSSGYFSTMDGLNDDGTSDGFPNLTSLALTDPLGFIIGILIGVGIAMLIYRWASSGDNARLFPVWVGGLTTGIVAAAMSAPIAAGVFGGVTGGGTDALVALFRTLGLNVFQSAFAQGLTSDPLDKTISYTVVFIILGALPVTVRTMYSRGEATVAD